MLVLVVVVGIAEATQRVLEPVRQLFPATRLAEERVQATARFGVVGARVDDATAKALGALGGDLGRVRFGELERVVERLLPRRALTRLCERFEELEDLEPRILFFEEGAQGCVARPGSATLFDELAQHRDRASTILELIGVQGRDAQHELGALIFRCTHELEAQAARFELRRHRAAGQRRDAVAGVLVRRIVLEHLRERRERALGIAEAIA